MVMANVCIGLIVGKTAKTVSPTRPLEVEAIPVSFKLASIPSRLITEEILVNVHTREYRMDVFTFQKDSVHNCDESPSIRSPICMVQPTGEGKEA